MQIVTSILQETYHKQASKQASKKCVAIGKNSRPVEKTAGRWEGMGWMGAQISEVGEQAQLCGDGAVGGHGPVVKGSALPHPTNAKRCHK